MSRSFLKLNELISKIYRVKNLPDLLIKLEDVDLHEDQKIMCEMAKIIIEMDSEKPKEHYKSLIENAEFTTKHAANLINEFNNISILNTGKPFAAAWELNKDWDIYRVYECLINHIDPLNILDKIAVGEGYGSSKLMIDAAHACNLQGEYTLTAMAHRHYACNKRYYNNDVEKIDKAMEKYKEIIASEWNRFNQARDKKLEECYKSIGFTKKQIEMLSVWSNSPEKTDQPTRRMPVNGKWHDIDGPSSVKEKTGCPHCNNPKPHVPKGALCWAPPPKGPWE